MAFKAPKGTRDIGAPEIRRWQQVEQLFHELADRFAYQELRTPTFEQTELFQRGVGDGTDIVQKEMYTFLDKAGRSMTLRPEGTAGVVRSFIQQGLSSRPFPVKVYYLMNLFRYENVQEGRYREFHQLGMECFGAEGPESDAELIAALDLFLERCGLKERRLRLNSLGEAETRARYREALLAYYRPHEAELCPNCKERLERNPLRLLDCKEETCRRLAQEAPSILDYLDTESEAHFKQLCQELDQLGVAYTVDPRLVRGLDYYSKTVFEYVSDKLGAQSAICGGGRYNSLVEDLGGKSTPACGYAIGEERLLKEMEAQGVAWKDERPPRVYIAAHGEEAGRLARRLALELRRTGLPAETELCGRSLKAQLKYAGKQGLDYCLVLGEEELQRGRCQVKRLQGEGQYEASLSDVQALAESILGDALEAADWEQEEN